MADYKIYLAGPIHDPDSSQEWRSELVDSEEHDGLEFISPLDLHTGITPEKVRGNPQKYSKRIVVDDLSVIQSADGLLVKLDKDKTTIGTPMEMSLAQYCWGKPVAIWYEDDLSTLSPWAHFFSNFVSDDRDEAIEFLTQFIDNQDYE